MNDLIEMFHNYSEERGFGPRLLHAEGTGFVTYHLNDSECYIENIYVVPEKRKSHEAVKMANEVAQIAKFYGIKLLTGSVNLKDKNKKRNMEVLLAYGMTPVANTEEMTYFSKEI